MAASDVQNKAVVFLFCFLFLCCCFFGGGGSLFSSSSSSADADISGGPIFPHCVSALH